MHSALGLTVAESLLIACRPVIVEGASDQHYLTAIKALLIAGGKIAPRRELLFPPAGGAKTTRIVASILTGRDEALLVVLLDGDEPGRRMARNWRPASTGTRSRRYSARTGSWGLRSRRWKTSLAGVIVIRGVSQVWGKR